MRIAFPATKAHSTPADDLAAGTRLSAMQGREIDPVEIFRLLNAEKLRAVLVGGHAVNARTGRPRATVDVDLIAARPRLVARALSHRYPQLRLEEHPVAFRFKDAEQDAIDVIRPESSALFKRVLRLTEQVSVRGVAMTIPDVEAGLALKFVSMISPTRQPADKHTDARDFILIVMMHPGLDLSKLEALGELAYAGGGAELLKLVANARAGRRLEF